MAERQAIPKFIRGTAVKVVSIISINTADSATITIDDPSDTEKVSAANMTKDDDKIYSYKWQSSTTDLEGDYVVTIKITSGSFTSLKQDKFTLVAQEGSE